MTRTPGRIPARVLLLALGLLSGTYALLAYIPFTYQAVIKFPMVSWIPAFVRLHPLLCLAGVGLNLGIDHRRWRGPEATGAGRILAAAGVGFLALLLLRAPLRDPANDGTSLAWAVAFLLLPLAWLLADAWAAWRSREWRGSAGDEARRLFLAASAAGLGASLFFPALAWLRLGPPDPRPTGEALALVWGWTCAAHLLVCLLGALAALGVLGLARVARRPWLEPLLGAALLGAGLVGFLRALVFRPIAFQGPAAWLVGGLLAALALAFLAVLAAEVAAPEGGENALDLALRPLVHLLRGHALRGLAGLALLLVLAGWALGRAVVFDWNFLFQKALVVLVLVLLFAGSYAALRPRRPVVLWVWALLLVPILAMNAFLAFDEDLAARREAGVAEAGLGPVLDQQVGRDPSVRLLREVLAPARRATRSIYRVLQRNSNISRDTRTDPVDIQHVDRLEPTRGPRPDIFVFVVDSLRRDYLGAYNPKVRFTPELDRFAADALAVPRAFTRYGATGLSEPSIWTGALMLHKQYITPFHPMNSLQKLLETDGYRGLVSMDSIMDVVVKPGPWLQPLDPGVATQDLRLEASLGKLEAALRARPRGPGTPPLFVYSQCQDLHISVINREGQGAVDAGGYPGFYAPYASRLRRLDAAFGRFVAFLKAQGRYEDSLIVVTADHGDSLGEEGRFGHAYTLFPEVVRIPLLIHLPAIWRQGYAFDADRPAFLTDLTPSLYYLLGHRPVRADRILGRPLFTVTAEEQAPYRQDHYLLASSYGAVFGILDEGGRSLYISDGVSFTDHLYRLDASAAGHARDLSPGEKARYDQLILDDLDRVNRFYRFIPPP